MLALLLAIPALLGLVLLALGTRGRRIDDHPLCRRCGFDLVGKPAGAETCPECGTGLSGRAVRIGHRRRRWGLVFSGSALVLLSAAAGTFLVANSRANLTPYKPAWLLAIDLEHAVTTDRAEARQELLARAAAGTLSPAAAEAITRRLLKIQADHQRPWDLAHGDLILEFWTAGLIPEAQFRTFLRQAPVLEFSIRPRIDETVFWLPNAFIELPSRSCTEVRGPARFRAWIRLEIAGQTYSIDGGEPLPIRGGGGSGPLMGPGGRSTHSFPLQIRTPEQALAPGRHTLRIQLVLTLSLYEDPALVEQFTVQFESPFEVVGEGADAIQLLTDGTLDAKVRECLSAPSPAWVLTPTFGSHASGWVRLERPLLVPMAVDVIWSSTEEPSREFTVTSMTLRPGTPTHYVQYSGRVPKDFQPGHYQVILKPSTRAALNTIDLTSIWGGEQINLGEIEVRESADGRIPMPPPILGR